MSIPRFQSRAERVVDESAPAVAAPRVHVVTFGCQMNKYDSLAVEGRFRRRGYVTTEALAEADVVLFNTCSVREHAEERVFSWVGELKTLKARRPDLVVGVMGCMAERMGEDVFGRSALVDLVVGTRSFQHLPELVDELRARREAGLGRKATRLTRLGFDETPDSDRGPEPYTGGRLGYLTVMRGCDLNCTFCIVPSVRGRVLSRPIAELLDEARWMIDQGAQVITLLGQTVNSYGEDLAPEQGGRGRQGRPALADLIERLNELSGLERIRLVTLHPAYVTKALAQALRDCSKADRFLPLPIQSGSDEVLRRMKRGYTVDLYRQRAELLREHCPDIELGSDWIVGFPGESDEDFEASTRAAREQRFVLNYVFQYSPRPGTRAADLVDDVPEAVKNERNRRFLEICEQVQLERMRERLSATLDVFVEQVSEKREGIVQARSHTGLPVSFEGGPELVGRNVRVKIEHCTAFGMSGVRVEG